MPRINENNFWSYISNGENETIEFKASLPSQFGTIRKIISAFSNTKGGSVVFGYDEQKKKIVGVPKTYEENLRVFCENSIYNHLCTIYTLQIDNKNILVLDVDKSKTIIEENDVSYVRRGHKILKKSNTIISKHLKDFIEEIQHRNRNPQDTKVLDLLNDIHTNPERKIKAGAKLYRCRILLDKKKAGKEPDFYGYDKKESFVPPPEVTRDLRANYRYIPYLYCANHPYTALVEVRPRLGADVSIATITVNEDLTLLDFTLKEIPSKMSNTKLNLFMDLSMLYSKPVTSDDDILDYIPTQFIAEYAKNLGYDGITFRSSLTPELNDQDIYEHQELDRYNIVIFNFNKCEATSSNIVNVTYNYLECEQVDSASKRIHINPPILEMYS